MKKIWVWVLLVFLLASIIPPIMRGELLYARSFQVEGAVKFIEWKSTNHQLPKIVVLNKAGNEIVISHSSVALNKMSIKVGDKIIKEEGSDYCLINGQRVRFSKYLGSDSISDVLEYYFGSS